MDSDPEHKQTFLDIENAIPISSEIFNKLLRFLYAESTLITEETHNSKHISAKFHLLPHPIGHYKDLNMMLRKAYKQHSHFKAFKTYKENQHFFNCINTIKLDDLFYLELQQKTAKGFMDIMNGH